ncbi:hypothetical protein lerEdw1_015423 [Lerista edwardsae]|nr:hypothetical protein lerEdw1_015423 [Lerista edwardsae]
MAKMRAGKPLQEELLLDHKQHKKQPSSGKYGSPAHWSFQRNGSQAWHINEDQIQLWAAELLLALEGLHQQGVLCQDLNPRNLLLDSTGHICLTYFGQWTEVEPQCCSQALEDLYCAPGHYRGRADKVFWIGGLFCSCCPAFSFMFFSLQRWGGISEMTEACDWWSFGALLYELLSGTSLSQNHPSGIHPHTQLYLPERLSQAASSLLSELLVYDPKERLGCGKDGVTRIKSHSFFSTIQWNKLVSY